jgi:hypothetical protein
MENVTITIYRNWGEEEQITVPRISKEQLLTIHPKYIFKHKPKGLSYMDKDRFDHFKTPENLKAGCGFNRGDYGVLVKDYLEVLASLPHFPNKKEAKEIRKNKKLR